MRKINIMLAAVLLPLMTLAQGWPANYGGVLMQGFIWNNYTATTWQALADDVDNLQLFDLIWVPNSGKIDANGVAKNMGYTPVYWLDHNSCWGSEDQLREMIKTFKAHNTGILMDLVINHKNGASTWTDFPQEKVVGQNTKKTYQLAWNNTTCAQICRTDEVNRAPATEYSGPKATGAADTGDDFDGSRDLDHTSSVVQANVKTYMDFLLNDLGYAGFRIDMTKGYKAEYTGKYNSQAGVKFAVGEYWDGNADNLRTWLNATKVNGAIQSATMDYALKYRINGAFGSNNWSVLSDKGLCADASYQRYAVTFVDNHDTGQSTNNDCLKENIAAANAFILTMPGTPCVWFKHYAVYKDEITNMIKARHAAGVHNQSSITTQSQSNGGYILAVKGTRGSLYLQLGGATNSATPSGYKLVQAGTNYKMFITSSIDWEHVGKAGTVLGYPVVSKKSGNYKSSVTVNVKPSKSGTTLVYTTDGSTPMSDGTRITASTDLTFTKSTALRVGVLNNGVVENVERYFYNVTPTTPSGINIYIRTSAPDKARIWAWNPSNNSQNYTGGTWPGKAVKSLPTTEINGKTWYYLKVNASAVSFLMNNGTGGYAAQTADCNNVTHDMYIEYPSPMYVNASDNGFDVFEDLTEQVATGSEETPTYDDVYILGNAVDVSWAPNKGLKMTTEDGDNYTANVDLKPAATQSGKTYSWFSFTKKLASNASNWSEIDDYRLGATKNDYPITASLLGKDIACGLWGASGGNAFMIETGKYTIKLNAFTRTLVVTKWDGSDDSKVGDVNGDGEVSIADLTMLASLVAAHSENERSDVNDDGETGIADVTTLVSMLMQ